MDGFVTTDALSLWNTRRVRRFVLTPDDVGEVLAAAGWVAVDAYRWTDGDETLGWPMALAAVKRRARQDGVA